MPENESINIDITGDVTEVTSSMGDALLSVEQVEEATQRLTAQLTEVRTLTEDPISLFGQDFATQIDLAERSVDRLLNIRKNIDGLMSSESKESNTALLGNMISYVKQRVSDLSNAATQIDELRREIGDLDIHEFNQSMKTVYSGLKNGLRQYADNMAKAVGTQSTDSIVGGFIKTPEYKRIISNIQAPQRNQHAFSEQNMQKFLSSIATVAISPLANNAYVDWAGERRSINRVSDLLPKQFANIQLGRDAIPTRDSNSADFSKKLSKQEISTLEKIILENQYVTREAEKAGLVARHNGNIFMNKDATRGHVNAFAGNIAHLFSLGAMGLPMYGIDDIYDPKYINSIASKTNKTITNARKMAQILGTQYGEWLDPAYYSSIPELPQNTSSWHKAGKVKAAGRKDRMQFLELELGNVGADGQITFGDEGPQYTPVVQSLYQKYLSKQKGATPFIHNAHNENEVFVKLPDEEAIQAILDGDPSKETALTDEIARVIGTKITHNGKTYSFSGLTKTHAIFTDEAIKKEIEKENPDFFSNGESNRTFDNYEAFAKAATYNRLQRVEGEDISELYGVDLGKIKVVVGNFKDITGLDGQNYISNRIVPEGFQGRGFAGKATYSPFSVKWLFKKYANHVDPKTGNLILPRANVNGGDLVIPPDVDLIEDFSNIKTNKQYNAALSSEELAEIRQREIADKGLFAKTTYDAANTNSRFMSAQLANTLNFTPEAKRYFTGVYMKELAAMQDPSAIIEKLFSGEDLLSQDVQKDRTLLNSPEAQKRIKSYVDNLNAHIQRGDVLLPEGEANYNMISAWLPDVINRTLVAGGKTLLPEQEALSLRDDVVYFLREVPKVGLARNPATVNGNVEATNKGVDEAFKKLAKAMGIDENALYVDPASSILKRLQGADEDGDTALVYAIKHSKNRVFADIMTATLVNTAERYKQIREQANLTDKDIDRIAESQTENVNLDGQESFSLDDPRDLARFWMEGRKGVLGMGSASAVTRNAFQLGISPRVATALQMAEKNYDINSTRDKTARAYLSTDEEKALLSEGAPIESIMNWAMKSRTLDEDGKMVSFDQDSFNRAYADKIAKSNFTSVNSPNGMQHAIAVWWAKNSQGADVSGGFDWDEIFNNLPQEFDSDSAAGQLFARVNELRKQYIQGDFLVFGHDLEEELKRRAADAYLEIADQINNDSTIPMSKKQSEIEKRYKAAGGQTVRHLSDYGITETNMLKNDELFDDIQTLIQYFGKENIYGQSVEYESTYSRRKVEENNKQLETSRRKKEENDAKIKQKEARLKELEAQDDKDKRAHNFDGDLIYEIDVLKEEVATLKAKRDKIDSDIANAEKYQKQAFDYYKTQGEYDRIVGGAEEYNRELWKSKHSKEDYIKDTDPAQSYYDKRFGVAAAYLGQLDGLLRAGNLDDKQIENIQRQMFKLTQGVEFDFMDKSVSNAKHLFEDLEQRVKTTDPQYNKDSVTLEEYNQKIANAEKFRDLSLKKAETAPQEEIREKYIQAASDTDAYITQAKEKLKELQNLYGAENAKTLNDILSQLSVDSSEDPFAKLFESAKKFSDQIDQIKDKFANGIFPEGFDKDNAFDRLNKEKIAQYKRTIETGLDSIKQSYESIKAMESQYDGSYDAQAKSLEKIDAEIRSVEEKEKSLRAQLSYLSDYDRGSVRDGRYSAMVNAVRQTSSMLSQLKLSRSNIADAIKKENDKYFESATTAMELRLNPNDIVKQLEHQAKIESDKIDEQQALLDLRYRNGNVSKDVYDDVTNRNIDLLDIASFDKKSQDYVAESSKAIFHANDIAANNYSEAAEALKKYNDIIEEHIKIRDKLLADGKTKAASDIQAVIDKEQEAIPNITEYFQKQKSEQYESQIASLPQNIDPNDVVSRLTKQAEDYEKRIDKIRSDLSSSLEKKEITQEQYDIRVAELNSKKGLSFEELAKDYVSESAKAIFHANDIATGEYSEAAEALKKYNDIIKEHIKIRDELRAKGKIEEADGIEEIIKKEQEAIPNITEYFQKQKSEQYESQIAALPQHIDPNDVVARLTKQAEDYEKRIDKIRSDLSSSLEKKEITQEQYDTRIAELNSKKGLSFEELAKDYIAESSKAIFHANDIATGNYSQTSDALKKYNEVIENHIKLRDELAKKGKIEEADALQKTIDEEQAAASNIQQYTQEQNQKNYASQIDSLTQQLGSRDIFSSINNQANNFKKRIDEIRTALAKDFRLGDISEADYQANLEKLDKLEERITPLQLGFNAIGEAASRAVTQFAHRVFSQAVNEAQNFTMTYDAAMTEIQMVTLKTEEEIDSLGDGLIDKAIDLRAGINEVTSAATSLYRQGLSDEQVDERLEDVIKFSKTANVNATDAIKLVTVATNNGVDSPERVFDVVSALGDSAATEAAEITKGLQKSLPAASDMGVTFEDLVAMLTVITAKTQLSGSVAGTTMRNVLSRLNRFNDVNGTYADSVRLLEDAGIKINDSNGKRSGTDILAEIGAAWEDFDDSTKSSISFALGGTEQYSNVLALLQGFSEIDPITGENLMTQLLETANNSEGITSEKYLHQIESLDGALTNLRSTFDKLVASAEATGVIVDFIDFVADGVSGFAELNTQTDGWISKLLAISTALIGIVGLAKTNPFLLALIGIAGGALMIGNALNSQQSKPTIADQRAQSNSVYTNVQNNISQAKEINEKRKSGERITDEELTQLKRTLASLNASGEISFDGLTDAAGNAIDTIDDLAASADATAKALDGAATSITEEQKNHNLTLSHVAANKIDDSKNEYENNKSAHDQTGINGIYQEYVEASEDDITEISTINAILDRAKNDTNSTTTPIDNRVLGEFITTLANSGTLSPNLTVDDGNTFLADLAEEDGTYTVEQMVSTVSYELGNLVKNPFTDGSLLTAVYNYTQNPQDIKPFTSDYVGFGDWNRENIYEAVIGREGVAGSGFENLLTDELVEMTNAAYENNPDFDFSDYLNNTVFNEKSGGYQAWLRGRNQEKYDEIADLDPSALVENTENTNVTKLTKSANRANASQSVASYETELSQIISGTRNLTGNAKEKFEGAADVIAELDNWDDIIQSKESSGLVDAWRAVSEKTEDGSYVIKEDVTDAEWDAFQRELESMYERTATMASYRSQEDIAADASKTYAGLTDLDNPDARYNKWQTLSPISSLNELLQKELISILGQDAVKAIINGTASKEDLTYYDSVLEAYAAQARVKPGANQDDVMSIVKALTGSYSEQMKEYNALQSEQTSYERANYSMSRINEDIATDEDYSLLASILGIDAETVQKMAMSENGKDELQEKLDKKIDIFKDTVIQALLAIIPEGANLTDLDGIDEELAGKVSDDVRAVITAIIDSLDITYDGKQLVVPVGEPEGLSIWETMLQTGRNYSGAHQDDDMLAEMKTAVSGGENALESFKNNTSGKYDWAKFNENNPLIAAAFTSYGTEGENYIDQDGMLTLINQALYGGEKTAAYYGVGASAILGEGYKNGISGKDAWNDILNEYGALKGTPIGDALIGSMEEVEEGAEMIDVLNEGLRDGEIDAENAEKALKNYNDAMGAREVAQMNKYKKNAEQLGATFEGIADGGMDASNVILELDEKVRKFSNTQWALDQYESGNRSNKVVDTIAEHFNVNAADLKKKSGKYAQDLIDIFRMGMTDEEIQLGDEMAVTTSALFENALADIQSITGEGFDIGTISVGGVVDISKLISAMSGAESSWAQAFVSYVKMMASKGATLTANVAQNENDVNFVWDTSSLGTSGYKGSYGGGGGSKKSAADKLTEKLGHGQNLYEHQIKMVQYEQTKYQNADELGNYGKMIEEEIAIEKAYLPVLESNLAALKNQLASVKKGSEDWYKLRDAILEAEEQYKEINNTIDENEKKLKENQQAILKLHTDLEEMVVSEIELRIENEKDMLDGSVSMQDTILDAIKQRYQDEWDLIKKDIEKKKEALQQEKDLIDERLDARREAEDEAAKYEELAELKKQLSLISMDSTRTKDAAELRESIAELEKEIGWDIAEKEAENEKNAIQDQIDAYDDYMTKGDEELSDLLEDANNFSEEVNSVLQLNQAELFEWLKQNVKEYANSLGDAQKQMIQSWEATYKQMLGITDTYWDEVNAILSGKDKFLEYMKQSNEYVYASEDERKQLLYQWEEAYDKWQKALKNDADYSHGDSGLGDWSGSEYNGSSSSSSGGGSGGSGTQKPQTSTGETAQDISSGSYYVVNSNGKKIGQYTGREKAVSAATSAARADMSTMYVYGPSGQLIGSVDWDGSFQAPTAGSSTNGSAAQTGSSSNSSNSSSSGGKLPTTGWPSSLSSTSKHGYYYKVTQNGKNVQGSLGGPYASREKAQSAAAAAAAKVNGKYQTKYFKYGGIADFTGPAWLDGTKQKPERILNADQTQDFETLVSIMDDLRNGGVSMNVLRDMARWSSTVSIPSSLSYVGNSAYGGNSANIGDVFVNITQAQINDDRDIEELANIVGEKFVKEIGKQGINVSRYNF